MKSNDNPSIIVILLILVIVLVVLIILKIIVILEIIVILLLEIDIIEILIVIIIVVLLEIVIFKLDTFNINPAIRIDSCRGWYLENMIVDGVGVESSRHPENALFPMDFSPLLKITF